MRANGKMKIGTSLENQRPAGTARKRFADNRQRFVSGVDFFKISKEEIQLSEFRTVEKYSNNGVTLITESGYLMLVKSFTDDLAWKGRCENDSQRVFTASKR